MLKNKYKIKSYYTNVSSRSWGACQENRDEWDYENKEFFKIINSINGKTIQSGFQTKEDAKYTLRTELNPKWIKKELEREIKDLNKKIEMLEHKRFLLSKKLVGRK